MATYRIKIVKTGFEFEAEGDKKFVLDMLNRFEKRETTTQESQPLKKKKGEIIGDDTKIKDLSPGEFIRRTGFKKDVDIVLAFGYYLEKYTGLSSFAPSDINKCYYDAKMEASNTSQYVIYLIRKGHLMEAKQPKGGGKGWKKYTLTSSGLEHIEKKLNETASDKAR